jgi:hypothetical protein
VTHRDYYDLKRHKAQYAHVHKLTQSPFCPIMEEKRVRKPKVWMEDVQFEQELFEKDCSKAINESLGALSMSDDEEKDNGHASSDDSASDEEESEDEQNDSDYLEDKRSHSKKNITRNRKREQSETKKKRSRSHKKRKDQSELKWKEDLVDFDLPPFIAPINDLMDDTSGVDDFFFSVLPLTVFDMITKETNSYAIQQNENDEKFKSEWQLVSTDEMLAFIGTMIIMGICQLPRVKDYWSEHFGITLIKRIFKRGRWEKINRYFHVSDNHLLKPKESSEYDKLGKIRELLKTINTLFSARFKPNCYLAVDESMVAFKGRCSFRQYVPLKPIKRGFKVFQVCDSLSGFSLQLSVYSDKADKNEDPNIGRNIIAPLVKLYEWSERIVYVDRFIHSVELAQVSFFYLCLFYIFITYFSF